MSGASSGQRTEIFATFNRKGRKGRRLNSLPSGYSSRERSAKLPKAHADARHSVISGKSGVSVQINKLGRFTPAGIVFFWMSILTRRRE